METYPGMTAIRTGSSRGRYSPQTMEELSRDSLEVTHTKPIVFTLLSIFFAPLSWAGSGWPGRVTSLGGTGTVERSGPAGQERGVVS